MTMTTVGPGHVHGTFRHEALFYDGLDEFRERMVAFIRDGLEADEEVLVVVAAHKLAMLRAALGGDAGAVQFADMADVGRNPARIIPVWRDFVANAERPVRGIGEPAFAERSVDELEECRRHESLLNLAFADSAGFWLLCPYDTASLEPSVVAAARRTHPYVAVGGQHGASGDYDVDGPQRAFEESLPEPAGAPDEMRFEPGRLDDLRRFVSSHALSCGLSRVRVDDLVLAVHEVAANSLRHAGGRGLLRLWDDGAGFVCEVRDQGVIDQPLVGRIQPGMEQETGRGLWIVNQLCDLVQVRSSAAGSVVRLRMDFNPR